MRVVLGHAREFMTNFRQDFGGLLVIWTRAVEWKGEKWKHGRLILGAESIELAETLGVCACGCVSVSVSACTLG